jgi:predicted MFS family arabinose efflux permease
MRLHLLWRILGSQALSSLGTSMSTVALAFMVYALTTGSTLHMGAVMAVSVLPLAVTSWLGGALLDRYSSRNLMVLADAARAVLIFAMPFAARQSVVLIYVVAGLIGVFSALFNPGQIKLVGEIAEREKLIKANSFLGVSRDGSELLGYLAGGLVVSLVGYTPAFVVDAGSYVLSALLLIGLPAAGRVRAGAGAGAGAGAAATPGAGAAGPWAAPLAPVRVRTLVAESPAVFMRLWRHPALRTNLLFAVLPLAALMMYVPNSYGLVLNVFKGSAVELGALEVVVGAGMIVGGLLMSQMSLAGDKNGYVAMSTSAVAFCLLGVYFSHLLWLSIGLMGLAGALSIGMTVPSITLVQEASAHGDQGRLIALRSGFGQMGVTAGFLVGGVLGQTAGIVRAFLVAGVAAIGLCLFIYVPYRIGAGRRAQQAWQAALATGERRAVARKAAVEAALAGRQERWPR